MENIQHITIDIMDNQTYEYIFANQYDQNRKIIFEVTENGNPFDLTGTVATFNLKKPDNTVVYLLGEIDGNEVSIDVVPQMTVLADNRIPYQLQFVQKSNNSYDDKDIDDNSIVISTISGYMKVYPAVVNPGDIESGDAFNALTDLISKTTVRFEDIIDKSKGYADDALTYMESASESASKAETSEHNAKTSEGNAFVYCGNSQSAAAGSLHYSEESKKYSEQSQTYSNNAKESEEETKRWRNDVYDIVDRLSGALVPMGTISFSELSSKAKITGHMYNINEAFISTSDFVDGGGVAYAKGSNVYCTGIGKWEVLVNPDGAYGGSCVIVISDDEPPIQPINNLWLQEHL